MPSEQDITGNFFYFLCRKRGACKVISPNRLLFTSLHSCITNTEMHTKVPVVSTQGEITLILCQFMEEITTSAIFLNTFLWCVLWCTVHPCIHQAQCIIIWWVIRFKVSLGRDIIWHWWKPALPSYVKHPRYQHVVSSLKQAFSHVPFTWRKNGKQKNYVRSSQEELFTWFSRKIFRKNLLYKLFLSRTLSLFVRFNF